MVTSKKSRAFRSKLPSKEELYSFIQKQNNGILRREIAKAYQIKGTLRTQLRALIKELKNQGLIEKTRSRRWISTDNFSGIKELEVYDLDSDGEPLIRPVGWEHKLQLPEIFLKIQNDNLPAPGIGDILLCRLEKNEQGHHSAKLIRQIDKTPEKIVGVYQKTLDGGIVIPADRHTSKEYRVNESSTNDKFDGELVVASFLHTKNKIREIKIIERIGNASDPRAISLIAIHRANIRNEFSKNILEDAKKLSSPTIQNRTDLRNVPLITIDGEDARDFDDAVFAEPDTDKKNPGGWHLIVAVADVAWFVRSGTPIDLEAYKRSNSVYFPDRVVPMLPEIISNNFCSLLPYEDRPCIAVDLWIDNDGNLKQHLFRRVLIKSHGRFTYEQVEKACDSNTPLNLKDTIKNLFAAYKTLEKARIKRKALELNLPESKVVFNSNGRVKSFETIKRLESHKMIEEFMITANVAAGLELTDLKQPTMYRIHDEPDIEKTRELLSTLKEFGYKLPNSKLLGTADFNSIISKLSDKKHKNLIQELILRCQSRAEYSPENIGHFGLNLPTYAHFTSPIRRYADLLVHRALITGLNFSKTKKSNENLSEEFAQTFVEVGKKISANERQAISAERDANDRYSASYLEDHIGETYKGSIRGVSRSGLFITIDKSKADGFAPITKLPGRGYKFDSIKKCLVNRQKGSSYNLGDSVLLRVIEASAFKSTVIFEVLNNKSMKSKKKQKK
ncbi:MAG: ribonuclease R [Alphaproteobacteria bacterium]|nr:ribonuclease R [Alphaproteobacteria bacterium]